MNKHQTSILLLLSLFGLSIISMGCDLMGHRGSNAPIVLGENIEGVEFGDSEDEVIDRLGEPDQTMSADLAGNRFLYLVEDGSLKLEVTISQDSAVGLGVITIHAYPAYDGETEHGIGTGDSRRQVITALGQPDTTRGRYDYYTFEDSSVSFEYREDLVYRIAMAAR